MPEIYRYRGLSFRMYLLEQHATPHVHVYYGQHALSINIITLEVLAGYLPASKRRQAEVVIAANQSRLVTMYKRARSGANPGKLRGE